VKLDTYTQYLGFKLNEYLDGINDYMNNLANLFGIPPIDPNPPVPRRDPLVLDTDKDGFISTVALADSNTYFDITGDGIKEKVSWIGANDGILAYDKNGNGKIDGIDEVFGNLTTSGFDELKELIDSNKDGKIDRRDELFNRLKIWHDDNGDGISQKEELVSLKDEGVKSIDVEHIVTTDIEQGSATLTEASRYTDTQGNRELAADVKLEYNQTLTTIDTATIPDYTVDLDTLALPNLRGYGFFMNSFVSYNTNEALKTKAQELVNNGVESMSSDFGEFIEIWSGYTGYVNGVKEKFNITGNIALGELDKKVWIIEKLLGRDINTTAIENNFETQMKHYENTTLNSVEASNVTIDFQKEYYNNYYQTELLDRYEGAFAMQAFYKFEGAHYDVNRAKFIIDDLAVFNTDVASYLNATNNSLEDKVYLVKVLHMLEGRFLEADVKNEILTQVTDSDLVALLTNTLNTNTRNIHVYDKDKTYSDDNALIFGSAGDDLIISSGANSSILAGEGDDAITTGSANDTLTYRAGDGSDVVYDTGGVDTFNFRAPLKIPKNTSL
jgi:hypothetical protein